MYAISFSFPTFQIAVQAAVGGTILARANIKALRKDVLAKCVSIDGHLTWSVHIAVRKSILFSDRMQTIKALARTGCSDFFLSVCRSVVEDVEIKEKSSSQLTRQS